MTKRHTRLFFIGGTLVFTLVFLGLTIDSHRQFGELTNEDALTPEVIEGKHVWHRNNCINCHTLFGEGAYYAPDLTKITQQRGEAYLTAFLKDPSQFYSEEVHRRLMPNPNLDDDEIRQVIAFLDWVANVDNQGWPPRPIVVTSGAMAGATTPAPRTTAAASDEPVVQGQALYHAAEYACAACHSLQPDVTLAGPSLAGIATRTERLLATPGAYRGAATDVAGYLREAIVDPSAHLVPGANFATAPSGGLSLMPADYGERLGADGVEHLVAFLQTLR